MVVVVVLVVVFGFGVSDGVVVIWVSKFGGPFFSWGVLLLIMNLCANLHLLSWCATFQRWCEW